MKRRSAIILVIIVALVACFGYLSVQEVRFGNYYTVPIVEAISQGLDLRGGVYAVYQAKDTTVEDYESLMQGTISVLKSRLVGKGYNEATVVRQGTDRIRVEIPDVKDPEQILQIIGTPAVLEFKDPDGNLVMDGTHIKRAVATRSTENAYYVVAFELDTEGTQLFADATSRLLGKTISIVLDDNVLISPTVNSVISTGQGTIEGNYSYEQADELALLIQSGALPLDIEQIEVRTISATLGENALSSSVLAGIIGVILVMIFMIVMYRLPGLVAALSLCIYILIDLFLLAVLPGVQLTLPGIAGIILSIGMAVDANVVIFERIKEELRAGKMLRPSINSGFKNALSAIIDSNITTIIAAVVLGIFGTGTIKGFAITLGVGVVVSMFTAVFVTRRLLNLMLGFGLTNKRLYGLSVKEASES